MSIAQEIHGLVSSYIEGPLLFPEFAKGFERLQASAEASGDFQAVELASKVEARVERYLDGYVSEEALRVQLNEVVPALKLMQVQQLRVFSFPANQNPAKPKMDLLPHSGSFSNPLWNREEEVELSA